MNSGTIWGRFVEKTRGQKSPATVPLMQIMLHKDGKRRKVHTRYELELPWRLVIKSKKVLYNFSVGKIRGTFTNI